MTPTTALHPDEVVERLSRHPARRGLPTKQVVISTVATNVIFLGVDADTRAKMVSALGDLAQTNRHRFVTAYRALWNAQTVEYPYLRGHLDPFTGWLDHDPEGTYVHALGDALVEAARMDLHASAEADGVQGDLLGQVLMAVEAPGDRDARGAFYTPPTMAALLAQMMPPDDWSTFTDPCCGAGGLTVAAIRAMRRIGRHPATVTWALNDIDRTALACAGVAMAIHGMPHVLLTSEDALNPAAVG